MGAFEWYQAMKKRDEERARKKLIAKRSQCERSFNARIVKKAASVEKLETGFYCFTFKNGATFRCRGPVVEHIINGIPYEEIDAREEV